MSNPKNFYYSLVFICLGIISTLGSCYGQDKHGLVLNISSYHQGYAWSDATTAGIQQELKHQYRFETHYLDTKRLSEDHFQQAADKAWAEVKLQKPDLIMLGDDNALKLLARRSVHSGIPTVFYGINANPRNYLPEQQRQKNITGILERVPVVPLLRVVTTALPDSRSILVLSDGSLSGLGLKETQMHQKESLKVGKARAYFIETSIWKEWQSIIEQANQQYDAIVLIGYHTVADDKDVIDYMENLRWSVKHAKIPIFSIQNHVGEGLATGALALDGMKHGKRAAVIAKQILDGSTLPYSIAIKGDKQDAELIFSQQNLVMHDITLPEHIKEWATILP